MLVKRGSGHLRRQGEPLLAGIQSESAQRLNDLTVVPIGAVVGEDQAGSGVRTEPYMP